MWQMVNVIVFVPNNYLVRLWEW